MNIEALWTRDQNESLIFDGSYRLKTIVCRFSAVCETWNTELSTPVGV